MRDDAVRYIAWAVAALELSDNSGALDMRRIQFSLKGAANDQSLAARVRSISEQQTGVGPARSAVSAGSGSDA